ncbi:MAG: glycoside hydrolase family 10 protein [Sumerlaeia bacterium]
MSKRFSMIAAISFALSLISITQVSHAQNADISYFSNRTKSTTSPAQREELRGVWITNVDSEVLNSKRKIAEMMDYLAEHNFNVIYPVVYNKGYTLYPSKVMEREFGVSVIPENQFAGVQDRDMLAEIIVEAHRVGIEVIPWFEFGFATSYNLGGGHILEAKPEWKALDQEGNLAKKNDFEWMNGFHPDVQNFMIELVMEVVDNYDVDGIQGDDRLPAMPSLAGYDDYTKGLYKKQFGVEPPSDVKDPQWVQFRADILSDFLERLHGQVKSRGKYLIVSSSPSYYDWSLFEYLQDSVTWTNRGIVDTSHPQAYRYELDGYKKIVDDLVANQFTPEQLHMLSPGILIRSGTYVSPLEYLKGAIEYNREKGVQGEVLFFYQGLRGDEAKNLTDNGMSNYLKTGPYAEPASLPYRDGVNFRPGGVMTPAPPQQMGDHWTQNPKFPGIYRRPGGNAETLLYDVEVPVSATYDLYIGMLSGPDSTANFVVKTGEDGKGGQNMLTFDQSERSNWGWMPIGQYKLKKGVNERFVRVEVTEMDPTKFTFTGPVMALINRKESPKTKWPVAE